MLAAVTTKAREIEAVYLIRDMQPYAPPAAPACWRLSAGIVLAALIVSMASWAFAHGGAGYFAWAAGIAPVP